MWCVVSVWCALSLLLGLLEISQAAWLRCYNGSLNDYLATPLNDPMPLTNCLDRSLPTVFYTFGYRGRVTGPATTAVLSAYLAKKKRNVVLLDWESEARSGLMGLSIGYVFSALPNAKRIGNELGDALMKLSRVGLNTTQIHLMGHSLGAHVMGYAGRRARAQGNVISRITGLDPASAFFEGPFALHTGLDRTCARFVDIIHSDPGHYGTNTPSGTVDFWPNYGGKGSTQPGCPKGDYDMFSAEDLCSHDRSWRFFVESISSPTAFPAICAANYESWLANNISSNKAVYMGELTSTRARGNFFLTTNADAPFGRGGDGLMPDNNQARRRRHSLFARLLNYFR